MFRAVILGSVILAIAFPADAQESRAGVSGTVAEQLEALQKQISSLEAMVQAQQQTIEVLQNRVQVVDKPVPEIKTAQSDAVGEISPEGTAVERHMPFLPEIGVVADIVGTLSDTLDNDEGNNRLSVRELELIFGHDIDPYARFDATLAFSDTGHTHVEEAFVTYWNLPLDLRGRIGRMHQHIGKASAVHRDSLDTVDEPLVVQRYLGEEGYYKTGLDLAGFTPLSGGSFVQELILGIQEGGVGEGGTLFAEDKDRPAFYSRLKNFWELSDLQNFEIGGTYMLGSADGNPGNNVHLFGLDGTYLYNFDAVSRLKLQGEIFFQSRDGSLSEHHSDDHLELHKLRHSDSHEDEHSEEGSYRYDEDSRGYYLLADYRFSQRWALGGRFDWVQPIELIEEPFRSEDRAYTGYLTFFQSEFARWRFQYQYAELYESGNDNRFFLQGTFAIGTHRHQLQ